MSNNRGMTKQGWNEAKFVELLREADAHTLLQDRAISELLSYSADLFEEIYFDSVECPEDSDVVHLRVDGHRIATCRMSGRFADSHVIIGDPVENGG